jgi:hypothetical protein
MKDWAESFVAALLVVGVVIWSIRVFMEAVYG